MKICFVHPTDIEENNDSITNYIRGIIKSSYSGKHDIIYVGISKNGKKKSIFLTKHRFFAWGKAIKKKLFQSVTLIYLISLYKFVIKNKKLFKGRILSFHQIEWALPFLYPIKLGCVVITMHGFHGAYAFLERKENITFYGRIKIIIYKYIEMLVIKKADKIIVVSQERNRFYIKKYSNSYKKFIFIPPFIDNQKFFYRENKEYLREKYGYPNLMEINMESTSAHAILPN